MSGLPTGTVTFLFTDVEGSIRLWEHSPAVMRQAMARHDAVVEACVERHGGTVAHERGEGDSRFAVFARATDAVAAACALQRALGAEPWPSPWPVRVRIALHTGEAELREGDYYGPATNRCARLRDITHGGQTVLSRATVELVRDCLPEGVSLRSLGVHRLKDLQRPEEVFQLLQPEVPADFPPLRSLDTLPNNLPIQLTSFVGREREMGEVKRLLSTTRLLTLTGAGGCGKTRLALQVAADILDEYADGAWLVDLAPLSDATLIPQTVASALGVQEQPGRPLTETLVDFLRSKSLLLVLDNCEHLLDACTRLSDTLLRGGTTLRVLATSREALGIPGETIWRVPSLSLPDLTRLPPSDELTLYEAVRLFVERALLSQPGFALTPRNALAVARVTHRLDGIPLAIELAAARAKALPVDVIADRLDDRFRLLTGGSRIALPRHQTLRAALDWSYALLSAEERILLRRLSVFAGGFTLEAAEKTCGGDGVDEGGVLDLVIRLVDKSLVVFDEQDGEARYRLLETVGEYARARLREAGEEAEVRRRHRDWYLGLAERAEPELWGPGQATWLKRLEIEHDNLRSALDWSSKSGEAEAGLRAAAALGRFWEVRSYWSEGRRRLEGLLAEAEDSLPAGVRAKALNWAGSLARRQRDYATAPSLVEESLRLFREVGDKRGIASSLLNLGHIRSDQGDYGWVRTLYEESLGLFKELDDRLGISRVLVNLALCAVRLDDYQLAMQLCAESLELSRKVGDKEAAALSLNFMGEAAERQGDYTRAAGLYGESLALYRELAFQHYIAILLTKLARVAQEQGHHDQAAAQYDQALAICREIGDWWALAVTLNDFGTLAQAQGDYERAAVLHEEALAVGQALRNKWSMAISLNHLGTDARCQGDDTRAAAFQNQSLALAQEVGSKLGISHCLEELARVACARHAFRRATQLFGAAEALRESIGAPLPPSDRAEYDRDLGTLRAEFGEELGLGWAKGRAMTLEQAIEYARRPIDAPDTYGHTQSGAH